MLAWPWQLHAIGALTCIWSSSCLEQLHTHWDFGIILRSLWICIDVFLVHRMLMSWVSYLDLSLWADTYLCQVLAVTGTLCLECLGVCLSLADVFWHASVLSSCSLHCHWLCLCPFHAGFGPSTVCLTLDPILGQFALLTAYLQFITASSYWWTEVYFSCWNILIWCTAPSTKWAASFGTICSPFGPRFGHFWAVSVVKQQAVLDCLGISSLHNGVIFAW